MLDKNLKLCYYINVANRGIVLMVSTMVSKTTSLSSNLSTPAIMVLGGWNLEFEFQSL